MFKRLNKKRQREQDDEESGLSRRSRPSSIWEERTKFRESPNRRVTTRVIMTARREARREKGSKTYPTKEWYELVGMSNVKRSVEKKGGDFEGEEERRAQGREGRLMLDLGRDSVEDLGRKIEEGSWYPKLKV
jgi:hypothetical protein